MEEKKEESQLEEELQGFDFVQFAMCDLHGIPRGRLVPRHMLSQACRDGVGVFSGTQYMGCQSEVPMTIDPFKNFPSGFMRPLAGTVRPLQWSSSAPKRRTGLVMCQLELKGQAFQECPRLVAQRQVDRLAQKGFKLKSAFECEFNVVKQDSLAPLGDCPVAHYANLDIMDRNMALFADLLNELRDSGVHVEYFFPEYNAGQYEASMEPQWGVGGADDAFLFRYGVRSFCVRHHLIATFMAIPFKDYHSAGFHFNHSLWSTDGRNLFHDSADPQELSSTARHWMAGLLQHAPAIMALSSPTLNCYRRMGVGFAPGDIFWNVDDRLSAVRVKTGARGNVFFENRMPSSAGNPYLIMAATVAAGLDGIEKRLVCPKAGRGDDPAQPLRRLPATLEEALGALEKDQVIQEALGGRTVDYFLKVKRDLELEHFRRLPKAEGGDEDPSDPSREREYYMHVM